MPQVTVQQMETQATEIMRAVREEQVAYEIVENGKPVAVLSPASSDTLEQVSTPDAAVLTLVEAWLDEEGGDDEGSFDDFLAFIDGNRLALNTR